MPLRRCLATIVFVLWGAALAGCADPGPVNPSFALTSSQARAVLRAMSCDRKPLCRPLVIVGGFLDPGFAALHLKQVFHEVADDRRIIAVALGGCCTFDQCRARIIAAVDQAFPSSDPASTDAVDVVGFSMGGLAAWYAAEQRPHDTVQRRLHIVRLFTISAPLRGADRATWPALNPLQIDMRPGSRFLQAMANAPPPDYQVFSYVRLGDQTVGAQNAALPGQVAWWLAALPLQSAHIDAQSDPRIIADIARHLRGAAAFATWPPAPVPTCH